MAFDGKSYPGWVWPVAADGVECEPGGAAPVFHERRGCFRWGLRMSTPGTVTRSSSRSGLAGDARGELEFGYSGGAERALAVVDFAASTLALWTSDWRLRQPVATVKIDIDPDRDHVLRVAQDRRRRGSDQSVRRGAILGRTESDSRTESGRTSRNGGALGGSQPSDPGAPLRALRKAARRSGVPPRRRIPGAQRAFHRDRTSRPYVGGRGGHPIWGSSFL